MPGKVTYLINIGHAQGFSETWYYRGGVDFSALDNVAYNFGVARLGLMVEDASIVGIRIQDTGIVGAALLDETLNAVPGYGGILTPLGTGQQDQVTTAALIHMYDSTFTYARHLALRGCLDEELSYDDNGDPQFGPAFRASFENFRAKIIATPWAIRAISKDPALVVKKKIQAIGLDDGAGGSGLTLITCTAHGLDLTDNPTVRIKGIKFTIRQPDNPNGIWVAMPPTGAGTFPLNQFVIALKPQLGAWGIYTGKGQLFRRPIVYQDIANVFLQRISSRKTGRPFFGQRGRAAVRRR